MLMLEFQKVVFGASSGSHVIGWLVCYLYDQSNKLASEREYSN